MTKEDNYHPPVEYTYDEFRDHFLAQLHVRKYEYVTRADGEVEIAEMLPSDSYEAHVLRTWDYFKQIYPKEIAMEKGSLFMLMCSHISRHIEQYNIGKLAVNGSSESGGLISESLMQAVHYYFTNHSIEELPEGNIVVTEIIKLAETKFKETKSS